MFEQKRSYKWLIILLVFLVVLVAGGFWITRWLKNLTPEDIVNNSFIQDLVESKAGEDGKQLFSMLPEFMGYEGPKYYLLIFLNNTELRPGGGFIGSYGVVKVENGEVEVIKVEGSEVLDKASPLDWCVVPPKPIFDYLKVKCWYFRDSNWSPDFAQSAKKSLEFFKAENGVEADKIDYVLAITPDVFEDLLKIVGPVTVEGIEFTAENFTETLEYEVEYGFNDRDISFINRKDILKLLAYELLAKAKTSILSNIENYAHMGIDLMEQKQLCLYSTDAKTQADIDKTAGSCKMETDGEDYLLWVDANMGALKTDHAMEREMTYNIEPASDGKYLVKATMKYTNTGNFDWRTTRYRSFVRVYLPIGVELVNVEGSMLTDKSTQPGDLSMGQELGRQWYGTFISVEPGQTRELSFSYYLPESITKKINDGTYGLVIQKQIGTKDYDLSLNLNFGKNISNAVPAENQNNWGDMKYNFETKLGRDQAFFVEF